jgi:hypothetical protein
VAVALFRDAHQEACHAIFGSHHQPGEPNGRGGFVTGNMSVPSEHSQAAADAALFDPTLDLADENDIPMDDPAGTAAARVRAESELEKNAAKVGLYTFK